MEIENVVELNNQNKIEKEQKEFLETSLGKIINTAVDIGIRAILPDFMENQIINIKDNLISYGLKDGITKTIDDTVELGKSAVGMVTGKFESVSQMQNVVKSGGLIDNVSSLLDSVLNKVGKSNVIDSSTLKSIKQGKNIILNNLEKNIEQDFSKQYMAVENTNTYISNWKNYFENQDFQGMEREYKKIEKQLEKIIPIENTIDEAKTIKMIHNLIKNNGQDFNLSNEQLELVEKFKK